MKEAGIRYVMIIFFILIISMNIVYDGSNAITIETKKPTSHVVSHTAKKYFGEADKYTKAEEHYSTAEKYLKKNNYLNADKDFAEARKYYEELGEEDLVKECNDQIERCEKYIKAEGYYSKAEKYLEENNYLNADSYFAEARKYYEELGEEDLVKECNDQIGKSRNIQKSIEPRVFVALNLTLITWIVYILLKGFKKDEKRIFAIFASIAIIISFCIMEFYFHSHLIATLFLTAIIVGISSLKILATRYKRKVYPNPYIAGNPIRSKEIFFGRKDVFQFIKNKLGAKRNITIVLYGERRTGKTSVLYQVENGELGKGFVPIYIDIQEMARVNEPEFFIKITEKIIESLTGDEIVDLKSDTHSEITELIQEYRSELNSYQVFNKFLDKIPNFLGEKYLILMFDEYEILEKKIEESHLSPDLIRYLRSQMQSREKFSFIFAGSRKLEELGGKHWSLMFNAATYKRISFLEKEDALDLMTIPVQNRIHYNDEAVDKILRLTACHPYFLQLFLQNLIDHLNDVKKNNVTTEEVEYVLDYILNNPSPHMIYIWQDLTGGQKIILSVLSEIIESEKGYISVKEVQENLLANNMMLDADAIKKALKELYQKEILDRRENNYNFKIDLLRYWIKTEHPLFKTMEDIR